ncbi:MAG: 1-acyl-sn-glycerol-3-phosphate acyltransferase [Hyphomonadaceae bacterium]|nr:1-acyl-sn-glycerol-3-phosphate acyltransferase [Hyphomonadaceae bacterium]
MTDAVATHQNAQQLTGPKHIVDVLIEERAPKLSTSAMWPVLRPLLYTVLNYDKAVRMADMIAPMGGGDALEAISNLLSVKLDITGLDRMPADGACIILGNHPTGITDGIALYDAVKQQRPDVLFYANSDAERVCARFTETLIPVEWVQSKRTRERTRVTLKMTDEAFEAKRPLAIFPAGRLARMREGVLRDPEWMPTAASLARKYEVPVLPVHMGGPYSFWFHSFAKVSAELRDITLFHELLNKQGKTYKLTFGPLIPSTQFGKDSASDIRKLKYYIERVLPHAPDTPFDPNGPECDLRDPPKPQA